MTRFLFDSGIASDYLLEEAAVTKVLTTQVGPDGVLHLTVPLGEADANKVVRVVVETLEGARAAPAPVTTREEWLRFIAETAGKWQGELERPPQGEYEVRDQWP